MWKSHLTRIVLLVGLAWLLAIAAAAAEPAERTYGWRGNWTGMYPEADPPVTWGRTAQGVVSGMTCQAAKPAAGGAAAGQPVKDGLIRDWLLIGPFPVGDAVKDFDQEQIPNEAALQPAEGDKAGQLRWQRFELEKKPDYENWGTTEFDWIDLAEPLGYKPNQVGYAHTYLFCPRPGRVRAVVEHLHGMKIWVNGKLLYESPRVKSALGTYVGISRQKQALRNDPSPQLEMDLKAGWNRLLVKLASYHQSGWRTWKFVLRLIDVEPIPCQQANIAWMTELPERTNAAPLAVGDRIFTPAEPDELLCLDKRTGKILWRRLSGFFEATPEAERKANPVFQQIAPLAEKLQQTTDYDAALQLRCQIQELLLAADKKKYRLKWDGHLEAHFGIVGFTTTPVCDGKHVYAFCGNGVVACYDLEGSRRWIHRLPAEEILYSCSPALIGGKLLVLFDGLHALDADSGKPLWSVPEVKSIASLIPARIAGTDVVSTRQGQVFRASDGKLLWSNPHIRQGDTGWGAPTILGNVLYLAWLGVGNLIVADFSGVSGEAWQPKVRIIEVAADHRRPNGEWLDRWTAGSPVIHEAVYYNVDQYGVFYAVDLESGKTLYKQDLGFDELHHYNAIGVGASVTLAGKYLYAIDNQGVCVVLAAGRECQRVATNQIQTVLQRVWPIPPQEILANGPPVFDGKHMYLRGEKYLYCIGPAAAAAAPLGATAP